MRPLDSDPVSWYVACLRSAELREWGITACAAMSAPTDVRPYSDMRKGNRLSRIRVQDTLS